MRAVPRQKEEIGAIADEFALADEKRVEVSQEVGRQRLAGFPAKIVLKPGRRLGFP
jgi:hypothetical protein